MRKLGQVFRRCIIALFLERKLIDRSHAASMLSWRHSGFSLDGSIGLYGIDQKALKRLAQYMAWPPISLSNGSQWRTHGRLVRRLRSGVLCAIAG